MKKNKCEVYIRSFHREVTGSCTYVLVKTPEGRAAKFLVDCGLHQEKEYNELKLKDMCDVSKVECILVTHAHIDHIGRLPEAISNGFNGSIYVTNDTYEIMPYALENSYSILARNKTEVYSKRNVELALAKAKCVNYNTPFEIAKGVTVTYFPNGHIPGAVIILIQVSYEDEQINLLFTGDYKKDNIFLDVPELPNRVKELPITIISESTYGNDEREEVIPTFENAILSTTAVKGDIVICVQGLDRMQRVAYAVRRLQDLGKIPKDYCIAIDGQLAQDYTNLYLSGKLDIKDIDFLPLGIVALDADCRKEFWDSNFPKIIFTTSGMGTYGPALYHIARVLERKDSLLMFTSYQAEGTLGCELKNTSNCEVVTINGMTIFKRGKVRFSEEFSSHAKQKELLEFLNQFENLRGVLINHGSLESKYAFRDKLEEVFSGTYIKVMNPYWYFKITSDSITSNDYTY